MSDFIPRNCGACCLKYNILLFFILQSALVKANNYEDEEEN